MNSAQKTKVLSNEQTPENAPTNIIGAAKGEFVLPADFEEASDELDAEIAEMFYS